MKRVLLLGYDPDTLDLSDADLVPGLTPARVQASLEEAVLQMRERGWQAQICFVQPDNSACEVVERELAANHYACVLIGAGMRQQAARLTLFEAVINSVHKAAPSAAIAFSSRPEDCTEAVGRWLA